MESIQISFHYDNHSDQSLFKLWKLTTKNEFVTSSFTSTQRLNNRSWRLLSKRFLLNHVKYKKLDLANTSLNDLSQDSLSDLKPKASQFLYDRPSLFSHSSNLSLLSHRKSTLNSSVESYKISKSGIPDSEDDEYDSEDDFMDSEDISDISEVDEGEEELSEQYPEQTKLSQEKTTSKEVSESTSETTSDKEISEKTSEKDVRETSENTTESEQKEKNQSSNQNNDKDNDENKKPNQPKNNQIKEEDQEEETEDLGKQRKNTSKSSLTPLNTARTSMVRGFSPTQTPSFVSHESHPPGALGKIFYFGNSPSPPEKQDSEPPATPSKMTDLSVARELSDNEPNSSRTNKYSGSVNGSRYSESPNQTRLRAYSQISLKDLESTGPTPYIHRQDSLFSNFQLNFKEEEDEIVPDPKKEMTIVPTEIEESKSEDGYTSTDISEDEFSDDEDEEFETHHHHQLQIKEEEVEPDTIPDRNYSSRSENDNEWVSESSSSDDATNKKLHPLNFNKRLIKSLSIDIATGNSNVKGTHYTYEQKRYSSPAIFKPKSLLSGLFETNQLGDTTPDFTTKPILKRSSTTGVITFDQVRSHSTGSQLYQQYHQSPSTLNQVKSKRPYIMLAKYNSSTDISKNYPHYHNNHVKKDILREYQESGSVKGSFHIEDENEDSVLGKQKSMVGISDFNVTANPASTIPSNLTNQLRPTSSEVPTVTLSNSNSSNNIYESLSTSLNKLSGSVPNNSRRNLLSRSSLSLTKLYVNSKSIFGKSDTNISKQELRHKAKTPEAPIESEQHKVNRNFRPASNEGSPNATLPAIAASVAKPELDDDKLGQQNFIPESNSKLSPKSTRRSMLSTELSESLRKSIIIDYKLGKIPLPTKVISNEKILRAAVKEGLVIGADFDDQDFDDYHSKGW